MCQTSTDQETEKDNFLIKTENQLELHFQLEKIFFLIDKDNEIYSVTTSLSNLSINKVVIKVPHLCLSLPFQIWAFILGDENIFFEVIWKTICHLVKERIKCLSFPRIKGK